MTTTLFLRIASVVSLLFTLGHSLGGLQKWSPMGENGVIAWFFILPVPAVFSVILFACLAAAYVVAK